MFGNVPNMKKWLVGQIFSSNEEVVAETEAYFSGFDKKKIDGLHGLDDPVGLSVT